jgi:hypothetical protein
MKNISLGAITTLLLLLIAAYGVLQWYRLPDNHWQWTKQITNSLEIAAQYQQENNRTTVDIDAIHMQKYNLVSPWFPPERGIQNYTQSIYDTLDALQHQKLEKDSQIRDILTTYQHTVALNTFKQLKSGVNDEISTVNDRIMQILDQLQIEKANLTPMQAKLIVAKIEEEWLDFLSQRHIVCFDYFSFPFLYAAALPQTEMLQPNDTLDLSIYLAPRKSTTNYTAIIAEKHYRPSPDKWVHYETILNNTGTFQLKGIISPPSCSTCMIKTYPFSRTYTVEACR